MPHTDGVRNENYGLWDMNIPKGLRHPDSPREFCKAALAGFLAVIVYCITRPMIRRQIARMTEEDERRLNTYRRPASTTGTPS